MELLIPVRVNSEASLDGVTLDEAQQLSGTRYNDVSLVLSPLMLSASSAGISRLHSHPCAQSA
jgi:hypothetical protein